ncbi:hypothetical protein EUX98_g3641 [Antrodiella citrinella]|uniref:Uncharacterized protein n=1 Tax=Antrodiella citrinella TaxID=2447956 RepID=A0A4S4MYK0_9APHY|nr:hypothetical protein EUX98_g3641 [Antrodiella citrinella]
MLKQILEHEDLSALLFNACTPGTLCSIRRLCKKYRPFLERFFNTKFNIHNRLLRFFTSPDAFHAMQLDTLTLISGSFALQFFAGILYPDSDLDLYVEHLFAQQVVDFLLTDGYRFQPTAAQLGLQETLKVTQFASPEPYRTSDIEGIGGVLTFKKDNGQTVQLIVTCQGKTAIEVILNFHSTVVMNFIAWDLACSLYPAATFERNMSLACRVTPESHPIDSLMKYRHRGWNVILPEENTSSDLQSLLVSPFGGDNLRWVGDCKTWLIRLPTNNLPLLPPQPAMSCNLILHPACSTWWSLMLHNGIVSVEYSKFISRVRFLEYVRKHRPRQQEYLSNHEFFDSDYFMGTAKYLEDLSMDS